MLKGKILFLSVVLIMACDQNYKQVTSIETLQKQVIKLNEKSSEIETKRNEMYKLIRDFNATRPDSEQFDITRLNSLLGAEEQELVRAMFREEKDITYSGLVKTVIAKNNEISDLNEQIAELHEKLPEPYIVKSGDTHYEVVLSYLMTKHNLAKEEALKIAWRTMLVDELLPGNEVWLMYNDGIVGSFVTQGSATIAPMTAHIRAQKRLVESNAGFRTISAEDSVLSIK